MWWRQWGRKHIMRNEKERAKKTHQAGGRESKQPKVCAHVCVLVCVRAGYVCVCVHTS